MQPPQIFIGSGGNSLCLAPPLSDLQAVVADLPTYNFELGGGGKTYESVSSAEIRNVILGAISQSFAYHMYFGLIHTMHVKMLGEMDTRPVLNVPGIEGGGFSTDTINGIPAQDYVLPNWLNLLEYSVNAAHPHPTAEQVQLLEVLRLTLNAYRVYKQISLEEGVQAMTISDLVEHISANTQYLEKLAQLKDYLINNSLFLNTFALLQITHNRDVFANCAIGFGEFITLMTLLLDIEELPEAHSDSNAEV